MGRKDDRRDAAFAHIADTRTRLASQTSYSLRQLEIYEPATLRRIVPLTPYGKTHVSVLDSDTVSAILNSPAGAKIAVLDFASYRYPGGGYANGAMAQEESMCMESNLYDILSEMEREFYEPNRRNLNRSLYTSRGMYIPRVVFERGSNVREADVIVMAAPNVGAAREHGVSEVECEEALAERVRAIMNMAADNGAEHLVLGAFGCGVFKNNPRDVAKMFHDWLDENPGAFRSVVFAIRGTGKNLSGFQAEFE